MKKIIVPVDFSKTANNAAVFAGNLANFYNADVWLYHSYELPVSIGEFTYPLFDVAEMQVAAMHELEMLAENTQQHIRSNVVFNLKAEMGLIVDGLASFCEAIKPDLVIMGLTGKDALTKLVVGSNTIKAIHEIKYPILVIPPMAEFIPVRKIGFACDYKQVKETTPLSLLKKIVTDFNAELHILNIDFENRNFSPEEVHESFLLDDMLEGMKANYHSIEAEDISTGINWFADKEKLDWVVVVPKKHTLVQKIFSRSQSNQLIYHTHVPVLCIHQ